MIGVPDAKWGEAVHAVVVLRAGATATEAELLDWCRDRIAGYKRPRSIAFIDEARDAAHRDRQDPAPRAQGEADAVLTSSRIPQSDDVDRLHHPHVFVGKHVAMHQGCPVEILEAACGRSPTSDWWAFRRAAARSCRPSRDRSAHR